MASMRVSGHSILAELQELTNIVNYRVEGLSSIYLDLAVRKIRAAAGAFVLGSEVKLRSGKLWLFAAKASSKNKEAVLTHVEAAALAERWMLHYGDAILRYAYSYLHNMDDAEDILQETLIRVLAAAPTFENASHEKAYLLRTAGNLAKNKIEYNKLRDTDELNDTLVGEEREDLSFLWTAVKNLPKAQSEAVHLFYEEGYSTAEISKVTGRTESTVRSDLRRAREHLKTILKEEYDYA